jgi:hypothetical protein
MLKIIRSKETSSGVVQWLQDPSEIDGNNLNTVRHKISRHFGNENLAFLKDKIDELAVNNKNKNIRNLYMGINDFKRGYQPRSMVICLQIPTF